MNRSLCSLLGLTLFSVSAKFHRLFDEGKWLLLPEMKILDEYNQHYVNQGLHIDFPVVKVKRFSSASIRTLAEQDIFDVRVIHSTTHWLPTRR